MTPRKKYSLAMIQMDKARRAFWKKEKKLNKMLQPWV